MRYALTSLLLLSATFLFSQSEEPSCQCETPAQKSDLVSTPQVRQADVMWSKRIWRELDLRQKINHPIYFPLESDGNYLSLFDVMKTEIINGCMEAYVEQFSPTGGTDLNLISCTDFDSLVNPTETVTTIDLETEEEKFVDVKNPISSKEVVRYRLKENWIFDKEHSRMVVHTEAIAPMIEVRSEEGVFLGFKTLFWINFQENRPLLAKYPINLGFNDNETLTYDDLFVKRRYEGFVIKESNVYDRDLREYVAGIDALLEGEKIEEKIKEYESDLWSN